MTQYTRARVLRMARAVQDMVYARVVYREYCFRSMDERCSKHGGEADGSDPVCQGCPHQPPLEFWNLTYQEFWRLYLVDKPWCGPQGQCGWFDDEFHELVELLVRKARAEMRVIIGIYEDNHKDQLPQWAHRL